MNILILFSQPWRVGGAETHVETLIKGLSEHKIILAVNEGSNKDKVAELQNANPNVKIIFIQTRGANLLRWTKDIIRLIQIVKAEQIDIISAQQRTAGLWAYLICKLTGINFVVTMHDAWHRALGKASYSRIFPHIVAVGKHLHSTLIEKFKFEDKQICYISNGIDFEIFKSEDKILSRKDIGLSTQHKIILHVSRLSDIKGAVSLSLIDSMNYIISEIQNAHLIIIGEGPLRKKIEQAAKEFNLLHGNIIEVRGFTDHIKAWYNAADLVVGEGRVAIEALACERPVVAIRNNQKFFGTVTSDNISGAVDVNFDGNNYVVTGESLAKEIIKANCISSTECRHIRQAIQSRLDIREMAKKYIAVFERVTKKSESPAK